MPLASATPAYPFLQGGGEMGALTRAHDWSQTPLGTPDSWPLSLQTTLGIILHSAFPMFLYWGDESVCFYNDAYRPSFGTTGKHPALGKPGKDVWPEVWEFAGALIDTVKATGEPVWFEDQLVPIFRNGQLEDVYWTFSYSPAYGDNGQISGVFVTCIETTEKVANAKLQQEKSELLRAVFDSSSAGISVVSSIRDEQGEIVDFDYKLVNRVTEQTNNRTDLIGKRYSAIHAAYKQTGIFDDFVQVINTGQLIERERHYTGEGFDNWYETVAVKLDDGVVFSFRDITAMVQARQQLEGNQQQILTSFEQSPVGIAVISEENLTFRMANSFYGELVGRTPDELVGKPLLEALPEIRGQGFDQLLHNVFATGNPFIAKEGAVQLVRRNQLETIYVDFTYQPQYEGNRISGILVVCVDVTEQVLARKAIEASERKFRQLIEEAPVATCLFVGRELVIEVANETMIGLWGKGPTVIGIPLADALPELKAQPFLALLDNVFTTGNVYHAQAERADLVVDGVLQTYYFNFTYKPLFDTDGKVYGIIDMAVDVTESVRAKQALVASEHYFRQLTDTVPSVIWETRPDGYCTYLNRQWYDLTGQTPVEAEGYGWLDDTHPDDKAESGRLFLEANQAQVPFNLVYRLRHKDGSYRWAIDKGSPRFAADGTYEGMIGTVVDIHDQKIAEDNLRASEQRFQAAIAAVQGILWTNNAKGEMEGEQPGWAALTGQTYADYQGYGWASAVHPDDAQPTVDAWQEAVARRGLFEFEHRVRMKAGHYEQFSIRAIPLLNADGTIREWVGVHTNVTKQRLAEAALRQSQEQQAFLLRLTDQLRSLTDPASVQYRAACVLGEYLGASRVGYAEDQNDGQHVVVTRNYTNGVPGIEGRYQYKDYGAALMAELQAGRRVVRPDIANDSTLTEAEKEAHAMLQLGATVNLPLMKAGRMTGILFLHYNSPHDFSEGELNLLNEVAERTWEAVERARVSNALLVSEAKLRSLITAAPVAIGLFVGRDLVIDLPNQTFIDIVGKGPDIVGKPLREVMPELITENQPFLQILDDVYTTGQMFQSFGSRVDIVQQGIMTHNYYNITYSPLYNEAGEIYAILDVAVDVTGQILAQQELAQQKSHLQNAVDIADLGTFEIDVATQIAQFSDKLGQWFGLTLPNKPVANFLAKVHPDDQTMVWQALDESMKNESQSRHDITYRIVDGEGATSHHLRSIGKTLYIAGQPQTISGIIQDVTPQVLSRQKIEESEARFRNLVNQATVATAVLTSRNMVLELANDAVLELWDKDRSILGKTLLEVLPEIADQPFPALLDRVFTTGETFTAQDAPALLIRRGKPETIYVDFSYQALRDTQNTIISILVMATDVTERVKTRQKIEEAEAALRGANQRLSLAMDAGRLGAYTLDLATGNMDVSAQCRMNYGQPPETPFNFSDLIATIVADDRERVQQAVTAAVETRTIYIADYRIIWPDGTFHWVRASGQPEYETNGQPVRVVGVTQEITAQRIMQEELERQVEQRTQQLQASVQDLERSNQNLQQFAYVASHDLQEPLRKIQSFGDLLKTQYSGTLGEGVDYLNRMQLSANRMSVLIKDLLTYSRISTRQDASTPVALNKVLNAVLTDLDLIIHETSAIIEVDALPTVQGDKSQLGQLFQNILNNALKFRKPDTSPQISITCQTIAATNLPPAVKPTRIAAAYYCIAVSDNGIGFDERFVDRIFQVFQRLHGKGQYTGTGIGLAICEKVTANHGGAITATSQPGKGATFSIYLPM